MAKGSATIDITALKVAGEPNKYITKISGGDGITIHDSQNQNSNYIQLTSNGMKVYKNSNMCFEASATELKASLTEAKDVFTVGYGSAIANKTETQILNSTSGVLDLTVIPFNTNFNLTFTVFFVGYSVTLGQSTTFENKKLHSSDGFAWNSIQAAVWREATGYSGELLPSGSMELSIRQPTPGEKQINYNITITGTGLTFDYATITAVWEESAAVKDQVFLTFGSREDGISKGLFSSAMGLKVAAIGDYSYAEGYHTIASGNYSHASGFGTQAIGDYSYSSGYGTKATIDYQTVFGKYNEEDSNAMFIIGNGTNDNNRSNLMVVGDNSIRIGNLDASHLLLDYHSLQMIDKGGSPYLHISDLRDVNGMISENFIGDGSNNTFYLLTEIAETPIVTVDGNTVECYYTNNDNYGSVFLTSAPNNNAAITIKYLPLISSYTPKAYTIGIRGEGKTGVFSIEEGFNNIASGLLSHASGYNTKALHQYTYTQNIGTIAAQGCQTAIGTYNEEDTYSIVGDTLARGKFAFIIGNGTADNARSNALTVDWNGNVVIPNGAVYRSKNSSGDERGLCYISTANDYVYGYDSYDNSEGGSYLYGNTTNIRSKGTISIGRVADNNTIYINGVTYPSTNIVMPNNVSLRGKTANGNNNYSLIYASDSNNIVIGNSSWNDCYIYRVYTSGSGTVSTVPNVRILDSGRLTRTTHANSSIKIKHDIKDIESKELDPHRLYGVEVKQFIYNDDVITDKNDCRYHKEIAGFIAEQLHECYPIAVDINEKGECEAWQAQYIIPPMLKLIQEQHEEIEQLKEEVVELKKRLIFI